MSFESVTWALEQPIGGAKKLILIGIASHADKHGKNAWPSIETLAGYAYIDPRSVKRVINELIADGYLTKQIGAGGTRAMADNKRPNLYHLKMQEVIHRGDIQVTPRGDTHVTPKSFGGDIGAHLGVTPRSPKPSIEPSINTAPRLRGASPPAVDNFEHPEIRGAILADFREVCRKKRKTVTRTSLDAIALEATKAGMTLEQALVYCCRKSWTTFESAWLPAPATPPPKSGKDPALAKIEADCAAALPPSPAIRARMHELRGSFKQKTTKAA